MSRYILITAVTDAALGRKLKSGTVIVDSAANIVLPTDVVAPSFANKPSNLSMLPMDAAALALMLGSTSYAPGSPLPPNPFVGGDAGA
jgi:hypothetical protein